MSPKRFYNGITNNTSADPFGALEVLDPTKWIVYHEDFVGPLFNLASIANTSVIHNGLSVIASANATISTATDAGGLNGCVKILTAGANDNESGLIQTISPGWVLTSGKKFIMETSFEIYTASTIAQNELFIGLASYQTGANFFLTNGTERAFDDGIGWYSPDADADIDVICGENDVFSNITVKSTYVVSTWYKMNIYFDGTDINCFVNDVGVGKITPSAIPVSVVGPTIYFKCGEAAAHQLLVDYLTVAKER